MTATIRLVGLLEAETERVQKLYLREAMLRSRGLIPQLIPFLLISLGGLGLAATAVWAVLNMSGLDPAPTELSIMLGVGVTLAVTGVVVTVNRVVDWVRADPEGRLTELQQLVRTRQRAIAQDEEATEEAAVGNLSSIEFLTRGLR